jgi:hypothetical protein
MERQILRRQALVKILISASRAMTASSPFPPLRTADPEGRLRVGLARSPRLLADDRYLRIPAGWGRRETDIADRFVDFAVRLLVH